MFTENEKTAFMPPLRNIIFDFGNVLFDLDLPRIEQHFRRYWGEHFEATQAKLLRDNLFDLYETGGISTGEFIATLCVASPVTLTEQQVTDAWNAIFIEMTAERFERLLELRKKYKVFLLSNINDLHERWIADYLLREHQIEDFETRYFDGVYYSHLIRLRKPNRDIYEYVLADAELVPEETLFIDDLSMNVEAAKTLGIRGLVKLPEANILDLIRSL